MAEWSKALVLGTSLSGRGFESHCCQTAIFDRCTLLLCVACWSSDMILASGSTPRQALSVLLLIVPFRATKSWLEMPGFEPGASRMRSEHSTAELHPHTLAVMVSSEFCLEFINSHQMCELYSSKVGRVV